MWLTPAIREFTDVGAADVFVVELGFGASEAAMVSVLDIVPVVSISAALGVDKERVTIRQSEAQGGEHPAETIWEARCVSDKLSQTEIRFLFGQTSF